MSLRSKRIAAGIVWTLAALLLISGLLSLLGWVVVSTQHASERRDAQIATLIQTVRDDNRDAARDRNAATRERAQLQRKLDASLASQDALLGYLRAHGIHLPTRLVTVIRPPRIVVRHPRATHHPRRQHRSTTSSTTPTGPGKSGHAPGHTKHPRHGRRHR